MRDPTPKRPVPFWRLFLRGWGWITVLAVPVFLVLGGISVHAGYHVVRLATDGVTTDATVTAKRRRDSDGDSRTDDREIYSLEFTFEADGREIADTARVSESFSHSVRRLEVVPIRYAAGDPTINEIEPEFYITEFRNAAFGLALLLGTAGPILWRQRQRVRRMIWVRDNGEARQATVTRHESTGIQVNDRSSYRLHWQDGNGATGRTVLVNKHALTHFPVGSEITVYFDPVRGYPPVWQVEVGVPAGKG